ncbi:MAG: ABC transporter permease subunit [Acidobacteriota bacterium]|nr:ABC transporter permease subunit [Acidobacteriota bacterium]
MRNELFKNKPANIGIALGAFLLLFILLVPIFSPHEPNAQKPARKLLVPNSANLFGTDQFGRDVLTRIAVGGIRSLGAAFVVVSLTLALSIFFGIAIGLIGGIVDTIFSRMIDILLAVPSMILALAIVGVLGVGFENLLIALVISFLAFYTRLVRSYALSANQRPDVITARLAGIGWTRIIATHIAPDVFRQMLIVATLDLGGIIISIAGLSFLGLGAQPPEAEWGAMLGEARFYFTTAPHLLLAPSAAILLAIVSANLIGNALRDAQDSQ